MAKALMIISWLMAVTVSGHVQAVEVLPITELLRRGFELKAVLMQIPVEKEGYAVERLYLQKGAQLALCVNELRPLQQKDRRQPASCVLGLYDGD